METLIPTPVASPKSRTSIQDQRKSPAEARIASNDAWLIAIGKGWHNIVKPLIEICNRKGYYILQVKEKFGGLRFYWMNPHLNGDPEFDEHVRRAEHISYETCEECGKQGSVKNRGGWMKTLCTEHASSLGAR